MLNRGSSENESQNDIYNNSGEFDEIINNIEQKGLTACVVVDFFDEISTMWK